MAALGEHALVKGYALAGVDVVVAESPEEVRQAWRQIAETVLVVVLTPSAAQALGTALTDPLSPMSVVLPA